MKICCIWNKNKKIHKKIPMSKTHRNWSGWEDSNSRPHGPKPRALPNCATPRYDYLHIIYLLFWFVNTFFKFFCFVKILVFYCYYNILNRNYLFFSCRFFKSCSVGLSLRYVFITAKVSLKYDETKAPVGVFAGTVFAKTPNLYSISFALNKW